MSSAQAPQGGMEDMEIEEKPEGNAGDFAPVEPASLLVSKYRRTLTASSAMTEVWVNRLPRLQNADLAGFVPGRLAEGSKPLYTLVEEPRGLRGAAGGEDPSIGQGRRTRKKRSTLQGSTPFSSGDLSSRQYQEMLDARYLDKRQSLRSRARVTRTTREANDPLPSFGGVTQNTPQIGVEGSLDEFMQLRRLIAVRDVPMWHRVRQMRSEAISQNLRVLGAQCAKAVKLREQRLVRVFPTQARAKMMVRQLFYHWKGAGGGQSRVREDRERLRREQQRKAEDALEARRQQRKLEFLLTQSELFAHFVKGEGPVSAPTQQDGVLEGTAFDDEHYDAEAMKGRAARAAQLAAAKSRQSMHEFDAEAFSALDPSSVIHRDIKQPACFIGRMKQYQVKGLNWLVSLYDQGINGILADEMGLGKTVQAISMMAHLAERNIWGPFMVVVPASTLHNWIHELKQFFPTVKVTPYWGTAKDRRVLRKLFSDKPHGVETCSFHVIVTSYQMAVADFRHLQRIRWQYVILDEAQAIKSHASQRWQTLLKINCRNRLLLTGTPIQNNMAELWALLHFIMPSIFDSHTEFSEWFSRDIEGASFRGKLGEVNEKQVDRLHTLLKPFMLRRRKVDVEKEMALKKEIEIHCEMTLHQKNIYRAVRDKIFSAASLEDLRARARMSTGSVGDSETLMNIFMQLRKVCNHPEIFKRRTILSPFVHTDRVADIHADVIRAVPWCYADTVPALDDHTSILSQLAVLGSGQLLDVRNASVSAISASFPSLAYEPVEAMLSLGNHDKIHFSMDFLASADFRFVLSLLLTRVDPKNIHTLLLLYASILPDHNPCGLLPKLQRKDPLSSFLRRSYVDVAHLLTQVTNMFIPHVVAPGAQLEFPLCSFLTRCFSTATKTRPWMLPGPRDFAFNGDDMRPQMTYSTATSNLIPIWSPLMTTFLSDSGKMVALDELLRKLKAQGHRVLLYSQMVKMLDILEDYIRLRGWKYVRFDGSSSVEVRRDLVNDFQRSGEIFIFLLSTRAGGLGINLTGADTVIFYDSDWNPTVDQQAMDRAHRLGQTREVTVYRMVMKGSIEARMLERAKHKMNVQAVVIQDGKFEQTPATEEVLDLLYDEQDSRKIRATTRGVTVTEPKSTTRTSTRKRKAAVDADKGVEPKMTQQ